jgi:transglutaminase-like putative cysteine protease
VSTPPLLIAAALAFWGWQAGVLLPALGAAALLEGARLSRWRWELSRADFNRISDLSSLVFVGLVVYLAATSEPARALTLLVQWLPLILLPLLVAQAYSTAGGVDPRIFFWSQRQQADVEGDRGRRLVDLGYPYLALVGLAASAANRRGPAFYAGLCVLAAWALWANRPRWAPASAWAGLLLAAAVAGYGGQAGLHRLQRVVEAVAFEWVSEWVRRDVDPFRASTAIGHIGRLKLSDRIVLRVARDADRPPPRLLREATYNVYSAPMWLAVDPGFTRVQSEADGTTWRLGPQAAVPAPVTISAGLRRGRGVLALPGGTYEIRRLTVARLDRNRLGAVKVDQGLGLVTYTALMGAAGPLDDPPADIDLQLPAREGAVMAALAEELRLGSRPPREAVATLGGFFAERFKYSTYTAGAGLQERPLEEFLRGSRSGHCEYFATATVLLLRAVGIPARYATGYAVGEWSDLEGAYVVRQRHAHSWALAWVDGAWRDVDTTPALWADEEAAQASVWQPVGDLWSWATYAFTRWRYGEGRAGLGRYLGWLLVPLVVVLAWRIYSRRRLARSRGEPASQAEARAVPGKDSEFYLIERRLAALGLARERSEPLSAWVERLGRAPELAARAEALPALLRLHYRHRFDPAGLPAEEREQLRRGVSLWLASGSGLES